MPALRARARLMCSPSPVRSWRSPQPAHPRRVAPPPRRIPADPRTPPRRRRDRSVMPPAPSPDPGARAARVAARRRRLSRARRTVVGVGVALFMASLGAVATLGGARHAATATVASTKAAQTTAAGASSASSGSGTSSGGTSSSDTSSGRPPADVLQRDVVERLRAHDEPVLTARRRRPCGLGWPHGRPAGPQALARALDRRAPGRRRRLPHGRRLRLDRARAERGPVRDRARARPRPGPSG